MEFKFFGIKIENSKLHAQSNVRLPRNQSELLRHILATLESFICNRLFFLLTHVTSCVAGCDSISFVQCICYFQNGIKLLLPNGHFTFRHIILAWLIFAQSFRISCAFFLATNQWNDGSHKNCYYISSGNFIHLFRLCDAICIQIRSAFRKLSAHSPG